MVQDYDAEMKKAIDAKSVVKLTEEEMTSWTGPVHYLTHFPVLKPGSVTTKVRIVANSKMKNVAMHLKDLGPWNIKPIG